MPASVLSLPVPQVKDSTLAGMDDAEQRAAEARDSAADIVRRTGDSIADSARQAGDSVAEGVRAVRDSVAETAGEVQGRAERAVDDTKVCGCAGVCWWVSGNMHPQRS